MLLMACLPVKAEVFNIHTKAHEVYSFDIENTPKITYKDNNLEILCDSSVLVFSISDFDKITFGLNDNTVGIENISDDVDFGQVFVYDINGHLVYKKGGDDLFWDLLDLESGIYIVKSKNTTFKINKK